LLFITFFFLFRGFRSLDESKFSWDKSKEQLFDVIIGSDVIYCAKDADNVAAVTYCKLDDKGIAIFVLPGVNHRWLFLFKFGI
jgi:predicted nicotinamide N-methyase